MGDPHPHYIRFGARFIRLIIERMELAVREAARDHHFHNRRGKIPLDDGLLRQIADLILAEGITEDDLPRKGFQESEQGLHQRGFARSVLPYDGEIIKIEKIS